MKHVSDPPKTHQWLSFALRIESKFLSVVTGFHSWFPSHAVLLSIPWKQQTLSLLGVFAFAVPLPGRVSLQACWGLSSKVTAEEPSAISQPIWTSSPPSAHLSCHPVNSAAIWGNLGDIYLHFASADWNISFMRAGILSLGFIGVSPTPKCLTHPVITGWMSESVIKALRSPGVKKPFMSGIKKRKPIHNTLRVWEKILQEIPVEVFFFTLQCNGVKITEAYYSDRCVLKSWFFYSQLCDFWQVVSFLWASVSLFIF